MKSLFLKLYLVFIVSIILFTITFIILNYFQQTRFEKFINNPVISNDIKAFFEALPQPIDINFLNRLANNFELNSKKRICLLNAEDNGNLNCEFHYEKIIELLPQLQQGSRFKNKKLNIIGPYTLVSTQGKVKLLLINDIPKRYISSLISPIRKHFNLLLIIISALVCIIPWLIISHRFSTPLSRLTRVIQAMKKENFRAPIQKEDLTRSDGIGELARVLATVQNTMNKTQSANKDLVARISHELHTPITRITLATGLISRKTPFELETTYKPHLDSIQLDCQQLVTLSDELMDLSRLASGRIEANKEPIKLISVIRQEISSFHALYQQKQILIKISSDEHDRIHGYQKELKTLFRNILENVYKYAEPNSLLHIKQKGLSIEFSNSSKKILPQGDIFEPFVHSGGEELAGHGLGLSFVKQIMELHDGQAKASYIRGIFVLELKFKILSSN